MPWGTANVCCFALQSLRRLREKLTVKCRTWMKVQDDGTNYASLLDRLEGLKDAVRPRSYPSGYIRLRAHVLRSTLSGLHDSAEAHALQKKPGLAKALYSELSGRASLACYTRFNNALAVAAADSAPAHVRAGASSARHSGHSGHGGGGGNRRGGSGSRDSGKPLDASQIKCFGCNKMGHYKSQCPMPSIPPISKA